MRFVRFILTHSSRTRWLLIASVVLGLIGGISSVALLILITDVLEGRANRFPVPASLVFVLICVLVALTRMGSTYLLASLGQGLVKELQVGLSGQVLRSNLPRVEEVGSHRLLAVLTDDVNSITQALVMVPTVAVNTAIVAGCFGWIGWLNPKLLLLVLATVVVGGVTYRLPMEIGRRKFWTARQHQDSLYQGFRALSEGIKELKLHRRRSAVFLDGIEETADEVRRLRVSATIGYSFANAWGRLLLFLILGLLIYVRMPWLGVGVSSLLTYVLVLVYVINPLQALLGAFPNFARAAVGVDRVQQLGLALSAGDESSAGGDTAATAASWKRLELDGVTYTYHRKDRDREFTLGPLNLAVEPGELLFLIGGNGSGKTTLAKLLTGLYPPTEGQIRVDGRPVTDENRDDYRQMFSVVFGDFYLFDRLLGIETADADDKVRGHLEDLEIAHKVDFKGGKLSTTDLSQGQRKRLALLTAYMEDRPIYLFDEWAADQDPSFKMVFYHEILPELQARGKTVVAISHDDRYYELGDRILKLEDGQISELPEAGSRG